MWSVWGFGVKKWGGAAELSSGEIWCEILVVRESGCEWKWDSRSVQVLEEAAVTGESGDGEVKVDFIWLYDMFVKQGGEAVSVFQGVEGFRGVEEVVEEDFDAWEGGSKEADYFKGHQVRQVEQGFKWQ